MRTPPARRRPAATLAGGLLAALGACAAPGEPGGPGATGAPGHDAAASPAPRAGLVVAVGGGGTPPEVIAHVAARAGGAAARVVVLPQASASGDGEASAAMWREAGAGDVVALADLGAPEAAALLAAADVVWMPGGDQSRLMERLAAAGLVDDVRAAHARGATVGGTSAGAAVLSGVMISGAPDPGPLRGGAMAALEGLGLVPWSIVDQHFVQRDRLARLLTAVLDHPQLVGLGLSEGTAALIDGGRVEVMGRGELLVFDARRAAVRAAERGAHQGAEGVALHVVPTGAMIDLDQGPPGARR